MDDLGSLHTESCNSADQDIANPPCVTEVWLLAGNARNQGTSASNARAIDPTHDVPKASFTAQFALTIEYMARCLESEKFI
jgi:hypothetical protein